MPTDTSSRKSPVNPMMPMPNELFRRVEKINNKMRKCGIKAYKMDVLDMVDKILKEDTDTIVYIDPPYLGTTGYNNSFNVISLISTITENKNVKVYLSEGSKFENATKAKLLTSGRKKGNISGNVKKKPTEEWLNIFY